MDNFKKNSQKKALAILAVRGYEINPNNYF